MVRTILVLLLAGQAAAQTNSAIKKGWTSVQPPDAQTIVERLAIEIPPSPSRVYAFTDAVGGFWEGRTFGYNGDGGYRLKGQGLLNDFVILRDGALLDRRRAARFFMLPHQARHVWNGGIEETVTVLPGRHGMIVSLKSPEPAVWEWIPAMPHSAENFETETDGETGATFIARQGDEAALAMLASTGGDWKTTGETGFDLPEGLKPERMLANKIVTERSAEVHVVILFGDDREATAREIRQIAQAPGEAIEQRKREIAAFLSASWFETNLPQFDRALHWAKISGHELVVSEFGKGIWAGLPWFHQSWGRDTFIALPGVSLVTGQFDEAAEIIRSFADYQIEDPEHRLYGRVPNRVNSPEDIIYNTADGTPWLIREIVEYALYTGDRDFAEKMFPVVERAIAGPEKNFTDELGFLTHADADTWMDARIEGRHAWSPRGNRAVEIQALWFNQLSASARLARALGREEQAGRWEAMAAKVKTHFNQYFRNLRDNALFDHLNEDGSVDRQIRPNQMFALTIPLFEALIDPELQAGVVRQVVSELTYPYGAASLAQDDPYFHPHHHVETHHFDAAYHNGLCWQWNAGPVVGGMTRLGHEDLAFELTRNLADQILNLGMPGSLSELVEPAPKEDGSLTWSGTYSQAWSVSEFVRNFYEDYLGLRVDMLERELRVAPRLPAAVTEAKFIFNLGDGERIEGRFVNMADETAFHFYGAELKSALTVKLKLPDADFRIHGASARLEPGGRLRMAPIAAKEMQVRIGDETARMNATGVQYPAPTGDLKFQRFSLPEDLQTIRVPDYLEKIRLQAEYKEEEETWR